jgi:pimeloyl-ACP methyl ester carboxylesterase
MPNWPPEPPIEMPSGRIVHVPGRGEMLLRDSGGDGPPVLLLHGWMFSADLNWWRTYGPLAEAGYRVLAVDHRGHGRGLRSPDPFSLKDCADDAAALLAHLGIGPVLAVGYSMGGPIASLLARDHPQRVAGLVLGATSMDWSEPRMKAFWRTMAGLRLALGLAPESLWRRGLRAAGFPQSAVTTWTAAELSRGSAVDIAEAGRELGRYDSTAWIAGVDAPAAVIVTTEDTGVPPAKQRALAAAMRAPTFEVRGDHGAVIVKADAFNPQLLAALDAVRDPRAAGTPTAAG